MNNFNDEYSLDNQGSSFGFSDSSLDDLLNESNAYAMNDDVAQGEPQAPAPQPQVEEDYSLDTPNDEDSYENPPFELPEEEAVEAPVRAPEPVVEEDPIPEPQRAPEPPVREPEPVVEDIPAPVRAEEPKQEIPPRAETPPRASEPVREEPVQQRRSSGLNIQTRDEKISHYDVVIRVLDKYRSLRSEDQGNIELFFNGGEPSQSESEIVYNILNSNPETNKAVITLAHAKGLDAIEKSFYVNYLTDHELDKLSYILVIFGFEIKAEGVGEEKHRNQAMNIVKAIDKIGDEHLHFLKIIEGILKAAE